MTRKVDDRDYDEYDGLGDDGGDGDHEDDDNGDDASGGQVVVPGALVVVGSRALGPGRQLNLLLAACWIARFPDLLALGSGIGNRARRTEKPTRRRWSRAQNRFSPIGAALPTSTIPVHCPGPPYHHTAYIAHLHLLQVTWVASVR